MKPHKPPLQILNEGRSLSVLLVAASTLALAPLTSADTLLGDQIRISSFANPGGATVTVGPAREYSFTHSNGQTDQVDVDATTITVEILPPSYPWGFAGRSGGDHFTLSWLDDSLDAANTLITDVRFVTPQHSNGVDACDLTFSDRAGTNSGSLSFSITGHVDREIPSWTLEVSFGAELPSPPGFLPTVLVGDPGNPNDPVNARSLGGVDYEFEIGLYEVTNEEYAAFLTAKRDVVDTLSLYTPDMQISRFAGPRFLPLASMERRPVASLSVFDAMRFCNWLHNGMGDGDTEDGAYTLTGNSVFPSNASTVRRNTGARWFLPTESEWHKAAFYTGSSATYFSFPGQNTIPSTECENYGNTRNSALDVDDPAAAGNSHYGARAMGGNLIEWVEPGFAPGRIYPALGTSWPGSSGAMQNTWHWEPPGPLAEASQHGFRIARLPTASAALRITGLVLAPDHSELTLTWTSSPGQAYTVQASPDLMAWETLAGAVAAGQENSTSFTESNPPPPSRYYRVLEN